MKLLFSFRLLFLLALALSGCTSPGAATKSLSCGQDQTRVAQAAELPKLIAGVFIDGERLAYNGYDVIKREKQVDDRDACSREEREEPCIIPVRYTVIERQGRVLAEFDEFNYGKVGNGNELGLFPLLGGEEKQLVISLTAPRGGRHYVVHLTPTPRVLLDSGDYEVGREEVALLDLDDDGISELSIAVTVFYLVFDIGLSETPLPQVIFKYDEKAGKYLPGNHLFQTHLVEGIEETKDRMKSHSTVARSLHILLDCSYAGKEEAGWAYFEREYNLPDKEEVKAKVLRVLSKAPAYKYIRDHRAM